MPTHAIRSRPPRGEPDPHLCTTDRDVIGGYLADASHYPGGHATAVARARSEADVAAVMRGARRILAVGAQSSLTGGATPMGDTVVSTERLDRILEVGSSTVTVEAGVPLSVMQDALDTVGTFYPPVPTFGGAMAGGVVATNAAGAATFKYGSTRAWVLGLQVVLGDGSVLDIHRGDVAAHPDGYFVLVDTHGPRRVPVPSYRMPDVPKRSAGYHAEPEMDLIDLFIGAEGTLGVITSVTFKVLDRRPATTLLWLPLVDEPSGLDLVAALRTEAQQTWRSKDPRGVDVSGIEHLDARSLQLIREDGADRKHAVDVPQDTVFALLTQLEIPEDSLRPTDAYDQIAKALSPGAADTPLVRLCRLLEQAGALDRAEVVLPFDRRRQTQLLALREAVPEGVNRRVGELQRLFPEVRKTAADMIVPFSRFADSLSLFRKAFARHGLDSAIWGHISDGNVHPNVIPRGPEDIERGHDAILDCGRQVIEMGGCPLAEHGVGRHPVKQALLRELYGETGISSMRAVKRSLDPDGRLAPGVLFPEPPTG